MIGPARWWVIYSREHNGWWRGGSIGYTPIFRSAGLYTEAEAREILDRANIAPHHDGGPCEFALPADVLMSRPGDEFAVGQAERSLSGVVQR